MKSVGLGAAVLCAVPVVAALLACGDGGVNDGQKGVGDQPGGVSVGLGDIAVAPIGGYVLFRKADELAVGFIDGGRVESLPVSAPSRLSFSKRRSAVYVGSERTQEIVAVDVGSRAVLWRSGISNASTQALRLESSQDDRFVLAANAREVTILDAASGRKLATHALERGLVDVEILPDSKRALVVEAHAWDADTPQTRITVLDLEASASARFSVPNCADDIVVSADGRRAFLAPTTCQKDPVSVIDLSEGAERFDRNLPGFGPVARAPGGSTVVAFYDRTLGEAALFDDPSKMPAETSERYHLMLIDAGTLEYDFAAVGEALPRYAVTPDGNVLLVDSSWLTTRAVRLFDVPTRSFRALSGPPVVLHDFVLTSDSRHAYVRQVGIFDLDVAAAHVSGVELDFSPTNLNISADDRFLFLRKDANEVCIFDLSSRTCRERFVSVVAAAP
jgi:outer membrane protein assembly factor BamB